MTQAQTDELMVRLDAQHDELLRRIDELDRQIAATLAEWAAEKEEAENANAERRL
ncbi:MAG: hypothetical protein IKU86_00140 [Thermoguttaceae bacterium]|nr:hypothetical protein [Thermoguttaceae bacterium]